MKTDSTAIIMIFFISLVFQGNNLRIDDPVCLLTMTMKDQLNLVITLTGGRSPEAQAMGSVYLIGIV